MNKIIIDLDNTIAGPKRESYLDCEPNMAVISRIREYKELGFDISVFTSRNMRTYEGNIGLINANTLPLIVEWLKMHAVPYDEIWVGKPWCGPAGFYVDDRAIRPEEFVSLDPNQVEDLLKEQVSGNELLEVSAQT